MKRELLVVLNEHGQSTDCVPLMVAKDWGHKVEKKWPLPSGSLQSMEESRESLIVMAIKGHISATSGLNQTLHLANRRLLLWHRSCLDSLWSKPKDATPVWIGLNNGRSMAGRLGAGSVPGVSPPSLLSPTFRSISPIFLI